MFTSHRSTVLAVTVLLGAVASGCGGGGGSDYPAEPTVVAAGLQEPRLVSGGLGHFTATVRSGVRADGVVVDFFLRSPVTGKCTALPYAAAGTVPFHLAYDLAAASVGQQRRFFSTALTYTPDTSLREARIVQSFQVPDLDEGNYEVIAAVRGKETACKTAQAVPVVKPTLPDLTHTTTALRTNAFRLGSATANGPYRSPPAFSVSSEIANVGKAFQGDVEVGFSLVIDGTEYPLLVEQDVDGTGPVKVNRHTYRPKVRGGVAQPMMQGDVRATVHRVHLSDVAREKLRSQAAEKTCTLKVAIDPDAKVNEQSKDDDVVSLPVQYLPGDAPCAADPSLTQVQYCFGPDDGNSSHTAPSGRVASQFQSADSSTNPTYLATGPNGPQGIPSRSVLNTGSHAGTAKGGNSAATGLLDHQVAFVVQPGSSAQLGAASPLAYYGALQLLGSTSFAYDINDPQALNGAKDFPGWKKDAKKTIFTDVDVLGFVPVKFTFGVEGEVGFGGNASIRWEPGANHLSWNLGVGPYLGVTAFAEASVDFVVCQVGVGVELDIFHVQPEFRFLGDMFYESTPGAGDATALLEFGVPIVVKGFDGDFYIFVKVPLVHEWKDPVVSWDGIVWSIDVIPPARIYIGPVGEFVEQSGSGDSRVHAVHASAPPAQTNQFYDWTGRISLEFGTYVFHYQNMETITLSGPGGNLTILSKCGTGAKTIAIPTTGVYTLQAHTGYDCQWATGDSAEVWWTQDGQAAISGLSGRAPTPDGSPSCSVGEWLFNSDIFAGSPEPAAYQCAGGVSLKESAGNQMAPWVNSPANGLWVLWRGQLPAFDPAVTQALFLFEGNGPVGWCQGASYTGDLLQLDVFDAGGNNIYSTVSQGPNPVAWDYNGHGQLAVPLTPPGPYTYAVKYHPVEPADCGYSLSNYNSAAFSMSVLPVGRWLVTTTCSGSGGTTTLPAVSLAGPADGTAGTLAGGSFSSEGRCAGNPAFDTFVSEYVVGAFDFSNQQAAAQDHDFFVGASVPHGYQLFVDGAPVASRAATPYASATDPCGADSCTTREKHLIQTLRTTQDHHVVEGLFTSPADGRTFSDDRIRWTPRATNGSLAYFYKNPAELQQALVGDPSSGTAPAPLMVLGQAGPMPTGIRWANLPDNCNAFANNQLDCGNSLLGAWGVQGTGFSALWDGRATLQDQVPYLVTVNLDRDLLGFWLDGQSYTGFQAGLASPVAYHPFPGGTFYGVLFNKVPPTASGVNTIRVATGTSQPGILTSVNMTSSLAPAAPGTFMVVFLDQNYQPIRDITGALIAPATGNHGTGQQQAMCLGAGCALGSGTIPDFSSFALVLASPIGDPQGLYAAASAIDLVASATATSAGASGLPVSLDLCVNGWCALQNSLAAPARIASPSFFPYAQGSGSAGMQALQSQQANTVVGVLNLGGAASCPGGDCSKLKIEIDLSYQQHTW